MSFLSVTPGAVTSAAGNLEAIGSALNAANAAAANGTTGMAAMADDEVSAAVQSMFATYAQGYRTASAKAAAFHAEMVRRLESSGAAYLGAEMANAQQTLGADVAVAAKTVGSDVATAARAIRAEDATVRQAMGADVAAAGRAMRADVALAKQDLVNAVNAPARALLGHQPVGNGSTGTSGSGQGPGGNTTSGSGSGTPVAKADPGSATTAPVAKTDPSLSASSSAVADASTTTAVGSTSSNGTSLTGNDTSTTTATVSSSGSGTTVTGTDTGSTSSSGTTVTGSDTGSTSSSGTTVTGTDTGSASGSGAITTTVGQLHIDTPFGTGQVSLDKLTLPDGTIAWTGSVELPQPLVLGVDALGAPASAMTAFHSSVTAFDTAVQTGQPLAAVDALARTPYNVANAFVYGQTTITQPLPLMAGYGSAEVNVPLGGLLAPARPVTVTLMPSDGTPTVVTLGGAEFGGLATALT